MSAPPDLDADQRLLQEAVTAAGALALDYFRAAPRQWRKGPGQLVTEADLAVDRLLQRMIGAARPDDGWLSEEGVDDPSRLGRSRVWMIDPIDGTRAFADGAPEFAISVALLTDGQPMIGAVYNPATKECFTARRGAGAWLGDTRLHASAHTEIEAAKLLGSRTEGLRRSWNEVMAGTSFTRIGSLAYKLALIAAGRFDGLVSLRHCHDWDVAAAQLLLQEAGGHLTDSHGAALTLNRPEPKHSGLVAAGNTALHQALLARLDTVQ